MSPLSILERSLPENPNVVLVDSQLTNILRYLLSFLDRTNIGNARLAGLERDLNMEGLDYNVCDIAELDIVLRS